MSVDEIREVIAAFAEAADRVRKGGLNGVEILAAFGYLPQAFLSPLCNHRTDEYGGSLKNRMRFLVELLTTVRQRLAPEQILGVRLPGHEFELGGLTLKDMQEVCRIISSERLADYLNIIAHTNITATGRAKHWAPTPTKHGVFVDLAAAIKKVVDLPVFTVGRIIDPAHANQIITDGKADVVGMTRAHICDPTIISKIKARQLKQIRPCVGANTCIASRYNGKSIRCMHNPELGRSDGVLSIAPAAKKIVVIGAGPAGLEAARVCAVRSHEVSVLEASGEVGGQLRHWASVKSTAELQRIIQWREQELERLGVAIELNTKVTQQSLSTLNADEIILATGAKDAPVRHKTAGHAGKPITVLSPTQLLSLKSINAVNAIIINDGRGQAGLVCAEWLSDRGVQLEIITEDIAVANDLDPTHRTGWYERLGACGVLFTPQSEVMVDDSHHIVVRNIYSKHTSPRDGVDLIVDWNGCKSVDDLTRLSTDMASTHSIGDCCLLYTSPSPRDS